MIDNHWYRAGQALLVLAAMGGLATGPALGQPQRRGLPAPQETLLPAEGVDVPMLRFNRLPMAEFHIDGKGPYRFIVDTGAAGVVLRSALAESLKLPSPPGMPPGAAQVKMKSPGGSIDASLVYIGRLNLGAAEFKGLWTVAADLPFGDGMDGVIGMNVFSKCLLQYDYPAGRIRLSHGTLPDADGQDILSYSTPDQSGSHPRVEFDLAGQKMECLIDTGLKGWFVVTPKLAEQAKILHGPVAGPKGLTAGGTMSIDLARLEASFRIGRYAVLQPIVRVQPSTDVVVVGTEFLRNFAVTFDAGTGRVHLARPTDAPLIAPSVRELGLSLKQTNGKIEIWGLLPQSPAAELGFKAGDVVDAFNGKPAAEFYGTEPWYELLQNADAIEVRYTPAGASAPKTVKVPVMVLVE